MSMYLKELYKNPSRLKPLFKTLFGDAEKVQLRKIEQKDSGLVVAVLVPDIDSKKGGLVEEVLFLTENSITFLYNINFDVNTKLYRLFMLDEFGLAYAYDCLI